MLTQQRKEFLLNRLASEGRLVAADLSAELAISADTIRRDLRELAAEGRLMRVHGGALPLSPTHRPFAERQGMEAQAKRRLAQAAVSLIRPGMVVLVDGGTTHQQLPEVLPQGLPFTLVTHSPALAAALEGHADIDLILIGGRIFRHSMVASGPVAYEALSRLRADLCFLGVTGVQRDMGLTTGDAEEAALKARMISQSAEVAVLATDDKLGRTSPWVIAPLTALGMLITCGARPEWLPDTVEHSRA